MGQVIVALDLDTRAEAETLIGRLGERAEFYKIGYQLFYGGDGFAFGKELIAAMERHAASAARKYSWEEYGALMKRLLAGE